MLNMVAMTGRLTGNPKLKVINDTKTQCKFSLAVLDDYPDSNGNRETDFFNFVAWNKVADFINTYFTQGQLLTVTGKVKNRRFTLDGVERNVTEIIVEKAFFASEK